MFPLTVTQNLVAVKPVPLVNVALQVVVESPTKAPSGRACCCWPLCCARASEERVSTTANSIDFLNIVFPLSKFFCAKLKDHAGLYFLPGFDIRLKQRWASSAEYAFLAMENV